VTAGNLVKVPLNRDGPQDAVPAGDVNLAGVTIHGAILGGAPSVNAVMHTHTPAGVAVSNHPYGLLPLSQHALRFYGGFGRHEYEGIALDDDEGPRLVENLDNHELLLLENHGLLTVGADLPQAFSAMYYAEKACQMQVATLSSIADGWKKVSPKTSRRTRRQFVESRGYMYQDWLAIRREVERSHPGFAEIQEN